ncbi:MAG: hypothetical protein ABEI74_01990 [Candidatus Pacearchaeota archaeon]
MKSLYETASEREPTPLERSLEESLGYPQLTYGLREGPSIVGHIPSQQEKSYTKPWQPKIENPGFIRKVDELQFEELKDKIEYEKFENNRGKILLSLLGMVGSLSLGTVASTYISLQGNDLMAATTGVASAATFVYSAYKTLNVQSKDSDKNTPTAQYIAENLDKPKEMFQK